MLTAEIFLLFSLIPTALGFPISGCPGWTPGLTERSDTKQGDVKS